MTTSDRIIIFDTTLRDGEQAPGATMSKEEKLAIAKLLERMGVDVIEAGFAIASPGDFDSVKQIATSVRNSTICSLARAINADIDAAGEALKPAAHSRIHTFISTSNIHLEYQIKKSKDQVIEIIRDTVKRARNLAAEVEWSAMDASRSDLDFLAKAVETAITSGATTVNIPDTVGYSMPDEYADLIRFLKNNVPNIDKAIISVHCHNDLGLAVANSLAAVQAGARQIECTINGIGERAGNAALEEVVMALKVRNDHMPFYTNIDTTCIYKTSRAVSQASNFPVQRNKAIVGANAFAHESGIHQDGMLKNRNTYEIMTPESVGVEKTELILGKHSGRAAFKNKLSELGYEIGDNKTEELFDQFKNLADKKKHVHDSDIIALIDNLHNTGADDLFILKEISFENSNTGSPRTIILAEINKEERKIDLSSGDGVIDVIFAAINSGVKDLISPFQLESYEVHAVSVGSDAIGAVTVRLSSDHGKVFSSASNTDIVIASAESYISAINKLYRMQKGKEGVKVDYRENP